MDFLLLMIQKSEFWKKDLLAIPTSEVHLHDVRPYIRPDHQQEHNYNETTTWIQIVDECWQAWNSSIQVKPLEYATKKSILLQGAFTAASDKMHVHDYPIKQIKKPHVTWKCVVENRLSHFFPHA